MKTMLRGSEEFSADQWFDNVYIELYPKLLAMTLRLTEDPHLAEDIVQSAFLTLYKQREELIQHPNICGWMVVTVRKKLQSERQKLFYLQEVPLIEGAQMYYEANEAPDFEGVLPKGLSQEERMFLDLYYRQGYSHAEIGRYLGCSETACRMRLFRILTKCRKLLRNEKI